MANVEGSTVSVFAPGATNPTSSLSGVVGPYALAFDAHGNLYVTNTGNDNSIGTTVSVFAPGSTTPTSTLTGLYDPRDLAFDNSGRLYVLSAKSPDELSNTVSVFAPGSTTPTTELAGLDGPFVVHANAAGTLFVGNLGNNTISIFGPLTPIASAGGVVIRTAQPGEPIDVGASSGSGLSLSDAELARLFAVAGGEVTIGGPEDTGNITVTSQVSNHPGYDTLILQTQQGAINAADGATLAVANLALQAGIGIGTTGAMAIDVTHLAFTSQSGAIHLSDAGAVTLTGVGNLLASSIPGDVFSSSTVGEVNTLLHTGGVSGQITYNARALSEGAPLLLADGNLYRISYQGNGGQDVTLRRVENLTSTPGPLPTSPTPTPTSPTPTSPTPTSPTPTPVPTAAGVSLVGKTLVIDGTAGDDVVRLSRHGRALRVHASFLPAGRKFVAFRLADVKEVRIALGGGNDVASVGRELRDPGDHGRRGWRQRVDRRTPPRRNG